MNYVKRKKTIITENQQNPVTWLFNLLEEKKEDKGNKQSKKIIPFLLLHENTHTHKKLSQYSHFSTPTGCAIR